MPRLPFIICIDVEPDQRAEHPDDRWDWDGFERLSAYLREARGPLQRATGAPVHFSWFLRMDPLVTRVSGSPTWVTTRYRDLIRELEAEGDEVGLHPHFWGWDDERQTWTADLGNPAWVAGCLRHSFAAFEQGLGRTCRSTRLGDRWVNDAALGLVERLGGRFDLSVEAGAKASPRLDVPFSGSLPDFTPAPRHPYHPAKGDFRSAGGWWKRKLWEIPLSTARPAWAADLIEEKTRRNRRRDGGDGDGVSLVYEGWHDPGDGGFIEGWVYDVTRPDAIVSVDIFEEATLIATLPADSFRPDLLSAGKGHGRHAFMFPLPDRLKDGRPHPIRIMVAGTSTPLHGTPKTIQCPRDEAPDQDYVALNMGHPASVFCGMFDELLDRPRSPHLAVVIRSDAGRHPREQANVEQSFEHILGHSQAERFRIATPAEAIALLS